MELTFNRMIDDVCGFADKAVDILVRKGYGECEVDVLGMLSDFWYYNKNGTPAGFAEYVIRRIKCEHST